MKELNYAVCSLVFLCVYAYLRKHGEINAEVQNTMHEHKLALSHSLNKPQRLRCTPPGAGGNASLIYH